MLNTSYASRWSLCEPLQFFKCALLLVLFQSIMSKNFPWINWLWLSEANNTYPQIKFQWNLIVIVALHLRKKKKGGRKGRKFAFQQFIQSSVGFGEDAYSCDEQLISFMVAFSEALEGIWRTVGSGLGVLWCLPGLWFMTGVNLTSRSEVKMFFLRSDCPGSVGRWFTHQASYFSCSVP